MKASRFLLGAAVLGALAWPAFGQYEGGTLPAIPQPGAAATAPVTTAPPPSATGVLTTPATGVPISSLPAGTVCSPACGPDGDCNGPFGGNGPVTYELYARTGPSLVVGGSELANRLTTGWQVGTGAYTLLFNTSRDAAWVLGTGISYTYNRGRQDRGGPLEIYTPRAPIDDDGNAATPAVARADLLTTQLIRGLHRTSFDYSLGRDWWLQGPGTVGTEGAPNTRIGAFVGGRYGTAHTDMYSTADRFLYLRKHSILHAVYLGTHYGWEKPMGNWIFFTNARAEVDYTFMNVVPPQGSDVVSVNLLFSLGVRY